MMEEEKSNGVKKTKKMSYAKASISSTVATCRLGSCTTDKQRIHTDMPAASCTIQAQDEFLVMSFKR